MGASLVGVLTESTALTPSTRVGTPAASAGVSAMREPTLEVPSRGRL